MPSEAPPSRTASAPPLSDWLRGAFLVVGFAAFGWFLLTRHSGPGRFEPHRRMIREFLRVGPCARQPYFVTMVGEGRNRRIDAVRTDCTALSTREGGVRP